jgi:hypothetical protein
VETCNKTINCLLFSFEGRVFHHVLQVASEKQQKPIYKLTSWKQEVWDGTLLSWLHLSAVYSYSQNFLAPYIHWYRWFSYKQWRQRVWNILSKC